MIRETFKCLQNSFFAGYFSLLSSLQNRQGAVVLMYHSVLDDMPPGSLVVGTRTFRDQMKYLKDHCEVISVKALCGYYSQEQSLPRSRRPQVVITMDDGCKDNFTHAFQVLKEFDLQATMFLVTNFIGTDKTMSRHGKNNGAGILSWDDIVTMEKSGLVTFAGHTQNHPDLTQLTYEQQKAEIAGSIKTVRERIPGQGEPSVFCYPYGRYNQDTLKIMKELDVKIAFTVQDGTNTGKEDPLELKRICAHGDRALVDFMGWINRPWA